MKAPVMARALRARVPRPLIEAVDSLAQRCGVSRSTAIRDLLVAGLTVRGEWPPQRSDASRGPLAPWSGRHPIAEGGSQAAPAPPRRLRPKTT
jgi:hypothetical protein